MKKKMLITALMGFMVLKGHAQTYGYDGWVQYPTTDLYDTGVMNMAVRAQAEMAARREQYIEFCANQVIEAKNDGRWNDVIKYSNNALECGDYQVFYLFRGDAYEQLGYLNYALSDYKRAKKAGFPEGANAYYTLKEKIKQLKKKK